MNPIVQDQIEPLRALCRKHRVERLVLFGSSARDDFDAEASDLDLLVEFEAMPPTDHADSYFGLLEDLEDLFGRRIDLFEPEPIENPYLWQSIERSRKVLYEAA